MLRIMIKPGPAGPTPDNPTINGGAPPVGGDDGGQPTGAGSKPTRSDSKFDAEKVSQPIAGYMGADKGPFACGNCDHFDGQSSCNVVSGRIDPAGCCNLFDPHSADESEDEAGEGSPEEEAEESPEEEAAEQEPDEGQS